MVVFPPCKHLLLYIAGGVVKNVTPFTVNLLNSEESQVIPSIHTQPVRFLGRRICASISDSENIETFISTFKNGLNDINSSKHNGIHKVWILQYLLLPRARWPIQIYEVPFSTILKLEQFKCIFVSGSKFIILRRIYVCIHRLLLVLYPLRA